MKPKVSVLVQTCDNYSHFWEGWYTMFNRFLDFDLDWQIYFCSEERDFPYQDDRIKQLKTFLGQKKAPKTKYIGKRYVKKNRKTYCI